MELVFKEECYAIMGACFEVYKEMGCGFVEPVYQECLELELYYRAGDTGAVDNHETHETHESWERSMELVYKEECYAIMGACFEVYKEMGCGFVEPVYQECLELELAMRSVPFQAQVQLELTYKDRRLEQRYKPDFVCYGKIIVEIKAVSALNDEHRAQVHNYLKATGHKLGLLVNFGHHPKVE